MQDERKLEVEAFCQRLHEVMSEKNFDQADIIKRTGANKSNVSQWYNGKTKPRSKNIKKLAHLFSCNSYWLDTGKGPKLPAPPKATSTGHSINNSGASVRGKNIGKISIGNVNEGRENTKSVQETQPAELSDFEWQLIQDMRQYWPPARWKVLADELEEEKKKYR